MRRKVMAANWKMNLDFQEAELLMEQLLENYAKPQENTEIIIAPPFPYLELIGDICMERNDIALSAQNCSEYESGAFTGEIAAQMLRSVGCDYVIIGHSERRQYFHESNETLFKKVNQALSNDLYPIYCIGETLEERKAGNLNKVLTAQMKHLFELESEEFRNIIIAYEPVWAIGTGETASPEQAQEVHSFIRKMVSDKMGKELADDLIILYGGSVKPSNAESLFAQADIDGGLVGGASLSAEDFVAIIKSV